MSSDNFGVVEMVDIDQPSQLISVSSNDNDAVPINRVSVPFSSEKLIVLTKNLVTEQTIGDKYFINFDINFYVTKIELVDFPMSQYSLKINGSLVASTTYDCDKHIHVFDFDIRQSKALVPLLKRIHDEKIEREIACLDHLKCQSSSILVNNPYITFNEKHMIKFYGFDVNSKLICRTLDIYPYKTICFPLSGLTTALIINSAKSPVFKCRLFFGNVDHGEFTSSYGRIILHLSDPKRNYCNSNGVMESQDPELYRLVNEEMYKYSVDFARVPDTVKLVIFGDNTVKIEQLQYEMVFYPSFDWGSIYTL